MTPDREQLLDQNYAQPKQSVEEAKALLQEAREYVEKKAYERDAFALATLNKIDRFLKAA